MQAWILSLSNVRWNYLSIPKLQWCSRGDYRINNFITYLTVPDYFYARIKINHEGKEDKYSVTIRNWFILVKGICQRLFRGDPVISVRTSSLNVSIFIWKMYASRVYRFVIPTFEYTDIYTYSFIVLYLSSSCHLTMAHHWLHMLGRYIRMFDIFFRLLFTLKCRLWNSPVKKPICIILYMLYTNMKRYYSQ